MRRLLCLFGHKFKLVWNLKRDCAYGACERCHKVATAKELRAIIRTSGFITHNGAADEIERLTRKNEALKNALREAIEYVVHWGSYAGEFFEEKHGPKDDAERLKKILEEGK